jgi:hypothetical protein
VAVVLFFVAMVDRLVRPAQVHRLLGFTAVLYAGVLMVASLVQTIELLRDPQPFIGYARLNLESPDAVLALEQIPKDMIVMSNNPEMIYYLMGRPAYMRPILFDHYSLTYRQDYEEQLAFAEEQLDAGGIYIQARSPAKEDFKVIEELQLDLLLEIDDFTFYASPERSDIFDFES